MKLTGSDANANGDNTANPQVLGGGGANLQWVCGSRGVGRPNQPCPMEGSQHTGTAAVSGTIYKMVGTGRIRGEGGFGMFGSSAEDRQTLSTSVEQKHRQVETHWRGLSNCLPDLTVPRQREHEDSV